MAGRWAGAGRQGRWLVVHTAMVYHVQSIVRRISTVYRPWTVSRGHRRRSRAGTPKSETMNLGVLRHVRIRTIELFCLLCWQQTRASEPRISSNRHGCIWISYSCPTDADSHYPDMVQANGVRKPVVPSPVSADEATVFFGGKSSCSTPKYDLIYPIMATSAAYVALTCCCYQRPLQTPRNGRRGPGLAGRRFVLGVRSGARQAGAGRPAGWR